MTTEPLILIADDDTDVIGLLQHWLHEWGYRTGTATNKMELMARLSQEKPALLLLDFRFGVTDGLELLRQLLDFAPDLSVVMLTGHGSINLAVSAMRLGAYDFLTKPPDPARLQVVLRHACEKLALARQVKKLESMVVAVPAALQFFGDSPAMRTVQSLIQSVAATDATVLILGESGTGKELAARTVHELSHRKNGPFVPLNMAALPKELVESLLFGHEKGAFTGADRAQAGACELANGGTLFLDEMGEMDLALQSKLLRFLQERTIQRVGNPKVINVDVRVVAATNRDLLERVRSGNFREDLYYRLNVVPVKLPPLRERKEDIPRLARTFLLRAMVKYRKEEMSISSQVMASLEAYHWPGNVRQLENLIERAVILSQTPEIPAELFMEEFRTSQAPPLTTTPQALQPQLDAQTIPSGDPNDNLRQLDQMEKQAIIESLRKTKGSVREVSHQLGLSQATVYRKLKRYGIVIKDFE